MALLTLDDRRTFKTHAEVLNEVFGQKTQSGEDFALALKSVWPLDKGGYVCFFPLAGQREDGGWEPPEDTGWLNIPSPDEKTITQIRLAKDLEDTPIPPDAPCAVFIRPRNGDYRFFGAFTRSEPGPRGIAYWHRTAAAIETQWSQGCQSPFWVATEEE